MVAQIRGIIFEIDSTLVDSNGAHAYACDMESAGNAGLKASAFRCGGWYDHDLQCAVAIYDGPADLLAHYNASPLAQKG